MLAMFSRICLVKAIIMIETTAICYAPKERKISYCAYCQADELWPKIRILYHIKERCTKVKSTNFFPYFCCQIGKLYIHIVISAHVYTLKSSTAHFCDFETGRAANSYYYYHSIGRTVLRQLLLFHISRVCQLCCTTTAYDCTNCFTARNTKSIT